MLTRLPFEGRIIPTKPPLEGRIVPARPSFKTAWRDLNRRSMTLWLLFFGCIPGMFLLAYVVNDLLLPEEAFLVVMLASGAAALIAACGGGRTTSDRQRPARRSSRIGTSSSRSGETALIAT